jgi:DNA-binding transcriptional regulator GbsR (MarR family)
MNTESEIERIRHNLLASFGRSMDIWGLSDTIGRMFGLLYLADEPLSLDDMAAELEVSKATISVNIRTLERIKSVQKIWRKGSRKDYYAVERDFNKILQEILRTNAIDEIKLHSEANAEAIRAYQALIGGDYPLEVREQAQRDLEKVHILTEWIRVGERWMKFFMDQDLNEAPAGELRRIEVEWEDG